MGDKTSIPEHPLVAKLVASSSNVMALTGYAGPASEGTVRLYPSLSDLSDSVEIAKSDIVHTAEATDSNPPGAVTVWVKRDAEVTHHHVESTKSAAQALPALFTHGGGSHAQLTAQTAGRLKIVLGGGSGLRADGVCQSRCQVCTSRCKVCTSRCGVCHSGIGDRFGQLGRELGSELGRVLGNTGFFGNAGRFRTGK